MTQQQYTSAILIQIHAACLQPLKAVDKEGRVSDKQRLIEGRMALCRMVGLVDKLLEGMKVEEG